MHKNREFPDCFFKEGKEIKNKNEIADSFNDYFAHIGENPAKQIPVVTKSPFDYLPINNANSMILDPVTPIEISRTIANLKNTSAGNDWISACLLKEIVHTVAEPLSRLLKFIDQNNILYDHQYGFRLTHSTTLAMVTLVTKLLEAQDKILISIGLFVDFSKAFNTVNFDILFLKLYHYGIRGAPLTWLRSYLKNRIQYVQFENIAASERNVRTGITQGSILGPILFLLYINDIAKISPDLIPLLFADDSNFFVSGETIANVFFCCCWFVYFTWYNVRLAPFSHRDQGE